MTNAERTRRVSEHYEHAVADLVATHAKLARSPLALAVRFGFDDPLDVHLLEVVANFPGGDADPLFTTEFGPNERFIILGKLHLTLASPRQLDHAIAQSKSRRALAESKEQTASRGVIKSVMKDGSAIYLASSPKSLVALGQKAKAALGLA